MELFLSCYTVNSFPWFLSVSLSCWCLLACLALWHWKINPYFLDQIWHFYEAAVVLPPNDSVLSSVLHTRANPGRAHHFSRFICVVSAASSILCWLVNLKVTLRGDKARSSQTATAAQRGKQKEIIFQILLREILEFYWRRVLRHGFTSLTASFLFSINSSWSEIRNRYPDCQLIRVLPCLLLACSSVSRSRDAVVHNNKLKSSPKFLLTHL